MSKMVITLNMNTPLINISVAREEICIARLYIEQPGGHDESEWFVLYCNNIRESCQGMSSVALICY